MMQRIVLLGPPACGKGTQATLMEKKFHLPHVSMGELLRLEVAQKSKLGLQIHKELDRGQLVSDASVIKIMKAWIETHEPKFILDGFPRTLAQAKALNQELTTRATPLDLVILLNLPLEKIYHRILDRLTCSNCGTSFSGSHDHLLANTSCPHCHTGILERRSDDTKEVVQERYRLYQKTIHPIIDYYEQTIPQKFHRIDANNETSTVFAHIGKLIDNNRNEWDE